MTARDVITPLSSKHAAPDEFTPIEEYGIGGDPAPEPAATSAVIMAAYAVVAYLAQKYAPTVFTAELDALIQVFVGSLLAWRVRTVVTAMRGLFERQGRVS